MGNNNEKLRLMNEHSEEMEYIRNQHDIKTKELLIQEKALQYGLEKHKAEIERLAQLDKYHYNVEIKKLEAQIRKNDQLHQRETKRIDNEYKNKQKSLYNEELKYNHIHIENMTKEKNRNDNENNKMKLDFEIDCFKERNKELEIRMKMDNEAERNRQIYEINKEKNELNFQIRNKEIDILRKKR